MSINFFKGHPTESLLPNSTIVNATTSLLTTKRDYDLDPQNRHPLTYGSDAGAVWVRDEVAKFSNSTFKPKSPTTHDFINLTAGSSYGIMNILAQTTLPHTNYTKQAFLITPTYFLINETFIDAGFGGKMTGIDEIPGGVDLVQLESKLKQFNGSDSNDEDLKLINNPKGVPKKIYKFVLYCIPTFSNPGGETYDLETRLKLIELAREYDMLIITDDVYDLLDYEQPLEVLPHPLPRLTHLDRDSYQNEYGNTIINSTFSKLIAPGLRFGYQESVNERLVHQLSQGGANVSGGTPSQLNSMIVGTILQNGDIVKVINSFRRVYSERAHLLQSLIKDLLPIGTKATGFNGGYFIWVTLPSNYDVVEICQKLKNDENIVLANGDNFEVVGDIRHWGKRSVRLSISYLTKDEIQKGIEQWAKVIKEMYN